MGTNSTGMRTSPKTVSISRKTTVTPGIGLHLSKLIVFTGYYCTVRLKYRCVLIYKSGIPPREACSEARRAAQPIFKLRRQVPISHFHSQPMPVDAVSLGLLFPRHVPTALTWPQGLLGGSKFGPCVSGVWP